MQRVCSLVLVEAILIEFSLCDSHDIICQAKRNVTVTTYCNRHDILLNDVGLFEHLMKSGQSFLKSFLSISAMGPLAGSSLLFCGRA